MFLAIPGMEKTQAKSYTATAILSNKQNPKSRYTLKTAVFSSFMLDQSCFQLENFPIMPMRMHLVWSRLDGQPSGHPGLMQLW